MKRGPSMKTMAIAAAALLFSLLTAAVSPARSEALPATFITVNGNGGARGRGRRLVPGLLLQPDRHHPVTGADRGRASWGGPHPSPPPAAMAAPRAPAMSRSGTTAKVTRGS